MNLKNAVHHEEHEEHEGFSYGWRFSAIHPKGDGRLGNNRLSFFVSFVFFVVQMRFLG